MSANERLEEEAFALVCYMITSACNLLGENKLYGPYRLIEAASRLIAMLKDEGIESPRLEEIRQKILAGQFTVMEDEVAFAAFLEDLVLALIPMMKGAGKD